jgi:hypothetical protein
MYLIYQGCHTWIMVHQDPSSFSSFVSPQTPMILESSAAVATSRFKESEFTDCQIVFINNPLLMMTFLAHRISIYCENVFIECWINPNNVPHLMIYLQLQGRHGSVEMDSVQIVQQKDLAIALATVAWFRAFCWLADLNDDHVSVT